MDVNKILDTIIDKILPENSSITISIKNNKITIIRIYTASLIIFIILVYMYLEKSLAKPVKI